MSSATTVPETHELTGQSALATLRDVDTKALLRDSVMRMRVSDGFSHARAAAFQLVLALIPGTIVLVALASELRWESLSNSIIRSVESLAPGPTADVFREAFEQGGQAGNSRSGWTALSVGGSALLISGTTAFGQIERTSNRIYGIETDRTPWVKYGQAFVMTLTAGTLVGLYFLVVGLGSSWFDDDSSFNTAWRIGRWPVGLLLLASAFAIVFKLAPRRHQPRMSWLAVGAALAVAGCLLVTALLTLYLGASEGFGETYGPLAGFMGIMLWAYGSAMALFFGLAFTAQLEALRAGVPNPLDVERASESEPDAVTIPYGAATLHRGGA